MDNSFIYIYDTFCFELVDFTNLLKKYSNDISILTKYIDPLIKDNILEKWLQTCNDSVAIQEINGIVRKAIDNGKSTEYIIKRIILELQLSD